MMYVHILTRPDGSVMVVHPAPKSRRPGEDDETFAARTLARTLEANPEWRAYPVTAVPREELEPLLANRRFRGAWRRSGHTCAVDMPAARAIWLDEVRRERAPKLTKSDVDFVRAQESGDVARQERVKIYRQSLRDITATERPRVDACATPEALEALTPEWPTDPAA